MVVYVGNAISDQMFNDEEVTLHRRLATKEEIPETAISIMGHDEIAKVSGYPYNRIGIKLKKGDVLFLCQVTDGRLLEGCTSLPEGFGFRWVKYEIE